LRIEEQQTNREKKMIEKLLSVIKEIENITINSATELED